MTKAISPQKKKECIDYALAHPEIGTAKLAADFGIGNSTLSGWLKKARQQCVFQTKLDTESTANWTASPSQTDRLVHTKLDIESRANWSP